MTRFGHSVFAAAMAAMAAVAVSVAAVPVVPEGGPASTGVAALDPEGEWDPEQALPVIEDLLRRDPDSARLHFLKARAFFLLSRYDEALAALPKEATDDPEIERFRAFVASIRETARLFVSKESAHFRMNVVKGPDEVLCDLGLDALEKARDAIGRDLGHFPAAKVVVEVYPDVASFTNASTLSPEAVRVSGAIALCKFNRIMMLTPRALLRGYPWLDTLCHEYVHYVLWQRGAEKVPIWLHEGIAKFEERRWRGDPGLELPPLYASLLSRRSRAGTLVPIDKMHPSLALLPTREDVVVAFAEVLGMTRFLWERGGYEAIGAVIRDVSSGVPPDQAVGKALGMPFDQFLKEWEGSLPSASDEQYPGLEASDLQFKEKDGGDKARAKARAEARAKDQDIEEIGSNRVRDLVRLSDLLEEKGRDAAAVRELAKAVDQGGKGSPIVANRLASILLRLKENDRALEVLEEAALSDRDFVTTWENLATARAARGNLPGAVGALEEATRLNPFNPFTRSRLREDYKTMGRDEDARREDAALRALLPSR